MKLINRMAENAVKKIFDGFLNLPRHEYNAAKMPKPAIILKSI
jgi:hypothetical protein